MLGPAVQILARRALRYVRCQVIRRGIGVRGSLNAQSGFLFEGALAHIP